MLIIGKSWAKHINDLEIKLSRNVVMFYKIRFYLSNNADQFSSF